MLAYATLVVLLAGLEVSWRLDDRRPGVISLHSKLGLLRYMHRSIVSSAGCFALFPWLTLPRLPQGQACSNWLCTGSFGPGMAAAAPAVPATHSCARAFCSLQPFGTFISGCYDRSMALQCFHTYMYDK